MRKKRQRKYQELEDLVRTMEADDEICFRTKSKFISKLNKLKRDRKNPYDIDSDRRMSMKKNQEKPKNPVIIPTIKGEEYESPNIEQIISQFPIFLDI